MKSSARAPLAWGSFELLDLGLLLPTGRQAKRVENTAALLNFLLLGMTQAASTSSLLRASHWLHSDEKEHWKPGHWLATPSQGQCSSLAEEGDRAEQAKPRLTVAKSHLQGSFKERRASATYHK